MGTYLKNCWELRGCELQHNGKLRRQFGECPAAKLKMGHSCWVVAGTFCDGGIQGTASEKLATCMKCKVYKKYNRLNGAEKDFIRTSSPEEERKYIECIFRDRSRRRKRDA